MKKTFPKNLLRASLLGFVLLCVFGCSGLTYALGEYTPLVPLPGTTQGNCTAYSSTDSNCKTDFNHYLPGAFNLAIAVAAGLAFVMIVYGGFKYMTTDAVMEKGNARETIQNALWGLLLVIGAWAILYTINPQILTFNLNWNKPALGNLPSGIVVVTPLDSTALANDTTNRNTLTADGVTVYAPACTSGSTQACVNVNNLQPDTLTGVAALEKACQQSTGQGSGCVNITGGTEGGHTVGSCHNQGTCLDISGANGSLNNMIVNGANSCQAYGGGSCSGLQACNTYSYGGASYLYEPSGYSCGGTVPSSGAAGTFHWHATYQ